MVKLTKNPTDENSQLTWINPFEGAQKVDLGVAVAKSQIASVRHREQGRDKCWTQWPHEIGSFATKPLGRQFKVIVPILKEAKAEYAKLQ